MYKLMGRQGRMLLRFAAKLDVCYKACDYRHVRNVISYLCWLSLSCFALLRPSRVPHNKASSSLEANSVTT